MERRFAGRPTEVLNDASLCVESDGLRRCERPDQGHQDTGVARNRKKNFPMLGPATRFRIHGSICNLPVRQGSNCICSSDTRNIHVSRITTTGAQANALGSGTISLTAPRIVPDHFPITPSGSAKPLGPYSPAMGFERLVFVSGQGALDPATNRMAGADVESQTEQCLRNVQTILEAAGSSLQHVLRCGVFLIDMNEFSRMNAVYGRVFGDHRPARTTVQAAALPGDGLRVEIDCIAYIP